MDILIDGIAVTAKIQARTTRSNPVEANTIKPVLYFISKGSNDQSQRKVSIQRFWSEQIRSKPFSALAQPFK